MSRGPRIKADERSRILFLLASKSQKEVAAEVNRSLSSISKIAKDAATPSAPSLQDSSIADSPESATTEQPA